MERANPHVHSIESMVTYAKILVTRILQSLDNYAPLSLCHSFYQIVSCFCIPFASTGSISLSCLSYIVRTIWKMHRNIGDVPNGSQLYTHCSAFPYETCRSFQLLLWACAIFSCHQPRKLP